jgi:hypothetical protein
MTARTSDGALTERVAVSTLVDALGYESKTSPTGCHEIGVVASTPDTAFATAMTYHDASHVTLMDDGSPDCITRRPRAILANELPAWLPEDVHPAGNEIAELLSCWKTATVTRSPGCHPDGMGTVRVVPDDVEATLVLRYETAITLAFQSCADFAR